MNELIREARADERECLALFFMLLTDPPHQHLLILARQPFPTTGNNSLSSMLQAQAETRFGHGCDRLSFVCRYSTIRLRDLTLHKTVWKTAGIAGSRRRDVLSIRRSDGLRPNIHKGQVWSEGLEGDSLLSGISKTRYRENDTKAD